VSQHEADFHQCFEGQTATARAQFEVEITFDVDTTGGVTSARLNPNSLGLTSLGQCVLTVAQNVQFEPQAKALSFSIPIRTRAVAR
jgi:TonB family protein